MTWAWPGLHPALVHFPVALVPLALMVDLGSWLGGGSTSRKTAALLWGVSALSAAAAFVAGRRAADALVDVPPLAQPAIGDHADWATATLVLLWALATTRAAAQRWPDARWSRWVRAGATGGGVVVATLVFATAHKGGALVYEHALGVNVPVCEVCEAPLTAPGREVAPGRLLRRTADGWRWTPEPADAAATGATVWPTRGVAFAVEGAHTLAFEPEFGDVQVNAWLDLAGFEGEVHLLHHLAEGSGGALVIHTEGQMELVDRGNEHRSLDTATLPLDGRHAFAVNAAGGHLKGLVDGKTVVHGHAPAHPHGKVALHFEGTGFVGVELVEVLPLD